MRIVSNDTVVARQAQPGGSGEDVDRSGVERGAFIGDERHRCIGGLPKRSLGETCRYVHSVTVSANSALGILRSCNVNVMFGTGNSGAGIGAAPCVRAGKCQEAECLEQHLARPNHGDYRRR